MEVHSYQNKLVLTRRYAELRHTGVRGSNEREGGCTLAPARRSMQAAGVGEASSKRQVKLVVVERRLDTDVFNQHSHAMP